MRKIGYITESKDHIDQLRKLLSNDFQLSQVEESSSFQVNNYDIVILDVVSISDIPDELKEQCRQSKTPLLLTFDNNLSPDNLFELFESVTGLFCRPGHINSIAQILNNIPKETPRGIMMSKNIIEPFVKAVKDVMSLSFCVEVECHNLYASCKFYKADTIISQTELRGDMHGELIFSIDGDTAGLLYASMIGCTPDDLSDQDKIDCVTEIVNQITGRVKTVLSERDYLINLSLPKIITDFNEIDKQEITSPIHTAFFKVNKSMFSLQLMVHDNKAVLVEQ